MTPGWMARARCLNADVSTFHPAVSRGRHGDHDPYADAKAICQPCPVREECLAHALAEDERHGCWGGTSPAERRRMRNRSSQ